MNGADVSRLAIVSTHPIQYYAPLFRQLAAVPGLTVKAFYLWDFGVKERHDPGFNRPLRWDIDLLEGYEHEFVPNRSQDPGTHHFRGIDNPDVTERVARFGPDVVLLIGYYYPSFLRLLRSPRLVGCKFLLRGDSHRLVGRRGVKAAVKRLLLRLLFRRFAGFLYVGGANRRYYVEHGVPDTKLFFSPHAVDNDRFIAARPAAEREALEWRRELGIPEGHRVMLFAGKFVPKKRPLDLIHAFRQAQVANATLLLVGSGPLEPEVRRLAAGLPNVRVAPFQNQRAMPRTLAAGDVIVLPSFGEEETWGLVINEAMCLARPVMVSDHCGCAEDLIEPGRNGWIFPAGDVMALAHKLREAAAPEVDLQRMGACGARTVERYHYREAVVGILSCLAKLGLEPELPTSHLLPVPRAIDWEAHDRPAFGLLAGGSSDRAARSATSGSSDDGD
jgi:glycosyltransferase involved in cell wall biosynthesis